jgi:hypothetical protein
MSNQFPGLFLHSGGAIPSVTLIMGGNLITGKLKL